MHIYLISVETTVIWKAHFWHGYQEIMFGIK